MNSYLDLVKEYAKKHKNKNRMSLFVILLAVALVATIFGMADMEMQTQQRSMKNSMGTGILISGIYPGNRRNCWHCVHRPL